MAPGPTMQSAPATQMAPRWVRINASDVLVRSRPDGNSTPVTQLQEDDVVRAVGLQFGWYEILPPTDVFSYVSAEYVDQLSGERGVVSVRSGTLRVRVGSNLRTLDPARADVQTRLERGTEVRILGKQGEWLKIAPPAGVHVFVAEHLAERISDERALALRARRSNSDEALAAGGSSAAAGAGASAAGAAARIASSQPARPPVRGVWSERLALAEAAIEAEAARPVLEQSWRLPLARLQPIALQQEEPEAARLAEAWIAKLREREAQQKALRAVEEVMAQSADERARLARELEQLKALEERRGGPFAAVGQLLESYAVSDTEIRYQLLDPLRGRVVAYLAVDEALREAAGELLRSYVGVRGARRAAPELGADRIDVREIIALQRGGGATSRPTREAGRP